MHCYGIDHNIQLRCLTHIGRKTTLMFLFKEWNDFEGIFTVLPLYPHCTPTVPSLHPHCIPIVSPLFPHAGVIEVFSVILLALVGYEFDLVIRFKRYLIN